MQIGPEIVDVDPVELAVVRKTVAMDEIEAFYDSAFPLLVSSIEQSGRTIAGPAYGLTFSMPSETPDGMVMDMGPRSPSMRRSPTQIRCSGCGLRGGQIARHLHQGSYDLLSELYAAVFSWIDEQGLTPGEFAWEVYVTQPTPDADPDSLLTEIVVPLSVAHM
ncbi:GyrI-like domain-containing protein [Gordonia terrae]